MVSKVVKVMCFALLAVITFCLLSIHHAIRLDRGKIQQQFTKNIDTKIQSLNGATKSSRAQPETTNSDFQQREILHDLADKVQSILRRLQNPADCSTARLYICRIESPCGLGCTIHHIGPCLYNAVGTNRTLVVEHINDWFHVENDMKGVYLPISDACTKVIKTHAPVDVTDKAASEARVVVHHVRGFYRPFTPWTPFTLPDVLLRELRGMHDQPDMWWMGQLHAYLTRLNSEARIELEQLKVNLNFSHPIVGIQVRRTDKVSSKEGKKFELSEYMKHVDAWYHDYEIRTNQSNATRRVFLATDEPSVYQEALNNYPQYQFLVVANHITSAKQHRYTREGLRGMAFDLELLSSCDFLVCTFSSNVGRLAYELMFTKHSGKVEAKSLDLGYLYNAFRRHLVTVNGTSDGEGSELRVGDVIYMKQNLRSGETGDFPAAALKECPWPVPYEGFDWTTQSRGRGGSIPTGC